jgi:hypothetical protein
MLIYNLIRLYKVGNCKQLVNINVILIEIKFIITLHFPKTYIKSFVKCLFLEIIIPN